MKNYLRKAIETRKQFIIQKLLQTNIYKIRHKHLYELTLTELEEEYNKIHQRNRTDRNDRLKMQF